MSGEVNPSEPGFQNRKRWRGQNPTRARNRLRSVKVGSGQTLKEKAKL